ARLCFEREAATQSPRLGAQIWRPKPREARHEIAPRIFVNPRRHGSRLQTLFKKPEPIPQPFYDRPSHEDRSFDRITGASGRPVGERINNAFYLRWRVLAHTKQGEEPRAVSRLAHSCFKTCLAYQRRLLVARHARNWNLLSEKPRCRHSVNKAVVKNLGEKRFRYIE